MYENTLKYLRKSSEKLCMHQINKKTDIEKVNKDNFTLLVHFPYAILRQHGMENDYPCLGEKKRQKGIPDFIMQVLCPFPIKIQCMARSHNFPL